MILHKSIFLLGMMASGKSTLAKKLATKFNVELISIDELIEKEAQKSITEIFEQNGEKVFRKFEKRKLCEVVEQINNKHVAVIDCGGGIVMSKDNQDKFAQCDAFKIYLSTTPEMIADRINDISTRPVLKPGSVEDQIKEILFDRKAAYNEVSSHKIRVAPEDTEEDTFKQIIEIVTSNE